MTAANRRYTRYAIPEHAMRKQEIKIKGVLGLLAGWGDCRVRDISYAGALVLTDKKIGIGDRVVLRLVEKDGAEMTFDGSVANCSKDPITKQFRLGIALVEPDSGRKEMGFLQELQDRYRPVL
ncbi:TPA: PilZ domain-containing protein [Pseudomonas aeruginosa]|nr:PilZ domain-containing protein [Pseudomonas aeruginosa]